MRADRIFLVFFSGQVHEIGHSLGLAHSSVSDSVMYPYYKGVSKNFVLGYDDILAVYEQYVSRGFDEDAAASTTTSTTTQRTSTMASPTTTKGSSTTTAPMTTTSAWIDDSDYWDYQSDQPFGDDENVPGSTTVIVADENGCLVMGTTYVINSHCRDDDVDLRRRL